MSEAAATVRADVHARARTWAPRLAFPELLCLPALALAITLPPLLRGELIGRGEMPHEYSLYTYVARALHSGHLPLWNPYTVSGNPGLADPAANVFYPFTVPLLLLGSVAGALNTMFVLHTILAGLFMHLYLGCLRLPRPARFAGALIYMLSGFMAWRIFSGDIPRVAAYAWIPLGLYVVEEIAAGRRGAGAALLGGTVLAAQFFAGDPQAFTHAALAIVVYAGFRLAAMVRSRVPHEAIRRTALLLGAMVVLGAGIACVQVLPTFEEFQNSNRPGFDAAFSALGSIPPVGLVTVLAPRFFGDEIHGAWGEYELSAREFYPHSASLYTGFFTVTLAITALAARRDRWHVRFFAAFAIAALWIALGKFGYLYRLAAYVPIVRSFRDVEDINILLPVSASVLAAFGFDRFLEPDGNAGFWNTVLRRLGITVGVAALVVGVTLVYESYHGVDLLSMPIVRRTGAESAVFVLLAWAASAGLLLVRRRQRAAPAWLSAAATTFLLADLVYTAAPLVVTGTALGPLAGADAVTRYLAADRSLYRTSGFFDRGPAFGVQDVGGEPSLLLGRYQAYTDAVQHRAPDAPRPEGPHGVAIRGGFDSTLLALLNVKYSIMASRDQPYRLVREPLRVVELTPNEFVYRHPAVFPRALAVGGYRVMHDPAAILQELDRDRFDVRSLVLLEQEPSLPAGFSMTSAASGERAPGRVAVTSYEDNQVTLRADFSRPGFVLLNDVYYPAWQALVDGRPAPVYRADYLFRAVALPAGRHAVRFVYRDRMLERGTALAIVTVLFGLAAAAFDRLRHR